MAVPPQIRNRHYIIGSEESSASLSSVKSFRQMAPMIDVSRILLLRSFEDLHKQSRRAPWTCLRKEPSFNSHLIKLLDHKGQLVFGTAPVIPKSIQEFRGSITNPLRQTDATA
jgi:hypothetical protein